VLSCRAYNTTAGLERYSLKAISGFSAPPYVWMISCAAELKGHVLSKWISRERSGLHCKEREMCLVVRARLSTSYSRSTQKRYKARGDGRRHTFFTYGSRIYGRWANSKGANLWRRFRTADRFWWVSRDLARSIGATVSIIKSAAYSN